MLKIMVIYRFLSKSAWSSDDSSESNKNPAIILSQSFGHYIAKEAQLQI